jgi:hypothetical protein
MVQILMAGVSSIEAKKKVASAVVMTRRAAGIFLA